MFRFFSLIPIDSSTCEHQRLNMRVNKMREYSTALRHTYRIVTVCVCVAVSLKPKCLFVHVLRPFVLFFQFEMQNKLNGIKVYTQRITMTTSANTYTYSVGIVAMAGTKWKGKVWKCVEKWETEREKKAENNSKWMKFKLHFHILNWFSLLLLLSSMVWHNRRKQQMHPTLVAVYVCCAVLFFPEKCFSPAIPCENWNESSYPISPSFIRVYHPKSLSD